MEDCTLKIEIDENGRVVSQGEYSTSTKMKSADLCTERRAAKRRATSEFNQDANIEVYDDVQIKYEPTDSMDSWLDPLATNFDAMNSNTEQPEEVRASVHDQNEIQQNRKKIRCGRTTPQQYLRMLDFFHCNKGLGEGKYYTLHGKFETKKKWCELARQLNLLKGAQKTPEQWQVAWRDLKSRTCIKARELLKERKRTGSLPLKYSDFSEVEKRVIEIISKNCVKRNIDLNDGLPEGELEVDNEKILQTSAQCFGINNISMDGQNYSKGRINETLDVEYDTTPVVDNFDQATWNDGDEINGNNSAKEDTEEGQTSEHSSIAQKQHSSEHIKNFPRVGKIARSQRNERGDTTKEDFLEIAKTQAGAMTALANSAKITAEAIDKIAESLSKLGDAAAAQASNNARQVQTQEKLTEAFFKMSDAMSKQTANNTKQVEAMEKMITLLQNILSNYS